MKLRNLFRLNPLAEKGDDLHGRYLKSGYPPIAVISFNRPDYLQQTLRSLSNQTSVNMQERAIYLFQDFDCPEIQRKCIDIFNMYFPSGIVLASPNNLGVALNILRAETLFFRDFRADCGYFFEDDLVLAPHYVTTLDRLREASAGNERIGYFACYGNSRMSADEQLTRSREIEHIKHFWGFGLFRHHWEAMQPLMEFYYEFIKDCHYKKRPHEKIYHASWDAGLLCCVSSQDDVKKAVTNKLGRGGINTILANAINIGREGVHATAKNYTANLWENQTLLDHTQVDFDFPDEEQLSKIINSYVERRSSVVLEQQKKFNYTKKI